MVLSEETGLLKESLTSCTYVCRILALCIRQCSERTGTSLRPLHSSICIFHIVLCTRDHSGSRGMLKHLDAYLKKCKNTLTGATVVLHDVSRRAGALVFVADFDLLTVSVDPGARHTKATDSTLGTSTFCQQKLF
jgi:hypothetical protein